MGIMSSQQTSNGSELRVLISMLLKHSPSSLGQDFQTEMLNLLTYPTSEATLMFYDRSVGRNYWNRLEVEIEVLRALERSLESATVAALPKYFGDPLNGSPPAGMRGS